MISSQAHILVVGSIAYDHIMRYEGVFQEKLLPGSLDALSISFAVSDRQTFFGGCGGNIAFHLKQSGEEPLLVGLIGHDFQKYEEWFNEYSVDSSLLIRDRNAPTSAAFIVSDEKERQIAMFDRGAAGNFSSEKQTAFARIVTPLLPSIACGIVAPTNMDLMLFAIRLLGEKHIPYFFDPGQVIHEFSKAQLQRAVQESFGVFVNEYEMQLLLKQTEWSKEILERSVPLIVETLGEKGSMISYQGKRVAIDAVHPSVVEDPTGCGDAYRAAFLKEIKSHMPNLALEDIEKAGNLASRLSAGVLTKKGTQVIP